jgi:hypothetical protein
MSKLDEWDIAPPYWQVHRDDASSMFYGKSLIYHKTRRCNAYYVESFFEQSRCYECGEPVPEEILDVHILAGNSLIPIAAASGGNRIKFTVISDRYTIENLKEIIKDWTDESKVEASEGLRRFIRSIE